MFANAPTADVTDFRQYAIWLMAIVIIAFGFRYAKDLVVFILDKLYQFFIQNNQGI